MGTPLQEASQSSVQLTDMLLAKGLVAFIQEADSAGWPAPLIHSAWYTSQLDENSEAHRNAMDRRRFGKAVLEQLEEYSARINLIPSNEDTRSSQQLLNLATWIIKSEGYGNALIASRACDIAMVPLANRVIDVELPLEEQKDLIQRGRALLNSPAMAGRILDYECQVQVFSEHANSHHDLTQFWDNNAARVSFQRVISDNGDVDEKRQDLDAALRSRLMQRGIDGNVTHAHDAVFLDDDLPQPPTTLNMWEVKSHRHLVVGLVPANLERLEQLVVFREAVGQFPLKPKGVQTPNIAPGKAAFREAWLSSRGTQPRNLYATAWSVYEQIRNDSFMDRDRKVALSFDGAQSASSQ